MREAEKVDERFHWSYLLVPLMVLPTALPLLMVRVESGMRAALDASASWLRTVFLTVFVAAWIALFLAETALLMVASLWIVRLVVL